MPSPVSHSVLKNMITKIKKWVYQQINNKELSRIWESMLYDDGEIETPEWHERILKQRKMNIENGSAQFISISELKASRGQ